MTEKEFEVAVVLTMRELAQISGITAKRLKRLLASSGVKLHQCGKRLVVARVALAEALPDVYAGLLARLRAGARRTES
jgi:hypothetical protein